VIAEHDAEEVAPEATAAEATEEAAEADGEATPVATEEAPGDEHSEEVVEAAEPEVAAEPIQAEWQQLQWVNEGPSPRFEQAMQYSPATNQLFVVGGRNNERVFDHTWAMDVDTLSWDYMAEEGKSLTAPILYSTVMSVDDTGQSLYLATGQTMGGQVTNQLWKLDVTTEVWQEITATAGPGPTPRYGGPGGNIGGNLVLTHGFGGQRFDDTWRFNIATGQWENITPTGTLPLARCLFAATPSDGNLVIHGGCATPGGPCYLDDAWILDTEANVWREILSDVKPAGRQHHSLVAAEPGSNQIILFGGQDASQASRNDLWLLDLTTGVWQPLEAPNGPSPRYNHSAVWIPGRGMLMFGGRNNEGPKNDMWLLSLQSAAPGTTIPTEEPAPAPAEPAPTPTSEPVSEHDGG
jgi:hypothetical protein